MTETMIEALYQSDLAHAHKEFRRLVDEANARKEERLRQTKPFRQG